MTKIPRETVVTAPDYVNADGEPLTARISYVDTPPSKTEVYGTASEVMAIHTKDEPKPFTTYGMELVEVGPDAYEFRRP